MTSCDETSVVHSEYYGFTKETILYHCTHRQYTCLSTKGNWNRQREQIYIKEKPLNTKSTVKVCHTQSNINDTQNKSEIKWQSPQSPQTDHRAENATNPETAHQPTQRQRLHPPRTQHPPTQNAGV